VGEIIRIGMDTSKHIFVLHGVDASERPVLRKKLSRNRVLEFFAKLPATVIGYGGLRGFAILGAGAPQARP
jgi:transposase